MVSFKNYHNVHFKMRAPFWISKKLKQLLLLTQATGVDIVLNLIPKMAALHGPGVKIVNSITSGL